jgi:hypothetical protein
MAAAKDVQLAHHYGKNDADFASSTAAVIVKGVKEGSAASKRRVQNHVEHVIRDGHQENRNPINAGLKPTADAVSVGYNSDKTLQRLATEGLEIQNYTGYGAQKLAENMHNAAANRTYYGSWTEPSTRRPQQEITSMGKFNSSGADWRGHTTETSTIGASTFGWDGVAETGAGHGHGSVNPGLRPDPYGDDVMGQEGIGGGAFGDAFDRL